MAIILIWLIASGIYNILMAIILMTPLQVVFKLF